MANQGPEAILKNQIVNLAWLDILRADTTAAPEHTTTVAEIMNSMCEKHFRATPQNLPVSAHAHARVLLTGGNAPVRQLPDQISPSGMTNSMTSPPTVDAQKSEMPADDEEYPLLDTLLDALDSSSTKDGKMEQNITGLIDGSIFNQPSSSTSDWEWQLKGLLELQRDNSLGAASNGSPLSQSTDGQFRLAPGLPAQHSAVGQWSNQVANVAYAPAPAMPTAGNASVGQLQDQIGPSGMVNSMTSPLTAETQKSEMLTNGGKRLPFFKKPSSDIPLWRQRRTGLLNKQRDNSIGAAYNGSPVSQSTPQIAGGAKGQDFRYSPYTVPNNATVRNPSDGQLTRAPGVSASDSAYRQYSPAPGLPIRRSAVGQWSNQMPKFAAANNSSVRPFPADSNKMTLADQLIAKADEAPDSSDRPFVLDMSFFLK